MSAAAAAHAAHAKMQKKRQSMIQMQAKADGERRVLSPLHETQPTSRGSVLGSPRLCTPRKKVGVP